MLPSADGSPLSGGSDDHTRFVPRAVAPVDDHTRVVRAADRVGSHTRVVAAVNRFDAGLDDRTTMVPMVRRPSRVRTLLPWAGFGLVAVVVVAATTAWASALRGPDDPLLANATPPAVFVEPASSADTSAAAPAPVDETTVPAAATRKPARPSLAAVVPPAPAAPVVVATTTVKPTAAAPTTTKPAAAATTTKRNGFIDLIPSEECTPSATKTCPAANQAGSTARTPTP